MDVALPVIDPQSLLVVAVLVIVVVVVSAFSLQHRER